MKIINSLCLLSVVMLLDSCGIYTSYKRPDHLPVEGLYRDSAGQSDTASIATLSWRKLFTDPDLDSLIEEGLRHNTSLQKALLQVEEAEATLRQSKAAFQPSLSLTPEGKVSRYGTNDATKTYSLGASASWEVDAFGSLRNAEKQQQATTQQSKAYACAVRTKLIATIADSYYTLLMLDRQVEITEQTVAVWRENIRTQQALLEAGRANQAEINQAEANCLSSERNVKSLRQQISEQENALSALIGRTSQSLRHGNIDDQSFPTSLSTGVPLALLSRRPDVRQAEYALQAAFYGVGKARSAFYPSITLSGTAGWTNSGGLAITNPGKWLLSAIGSLTQPLFSRGQNEANLRIAKAQQQEALLSYTQSILDASTEVNNALKQWQTAQQKEKIDQKEIEKLTAAVKNTKLLMENSTTNYLDVLTAEQNLLSARLSAVSDRMDELEGVLSLYHALGGGAE